MKVQVVTRESACIDGAKHISLNADHSGINKFASESDPSFRQIKDVILESVNRPYRRLTLEQKGYLEKIPRVEGASIESVWVESYPGCLPDTRMDLLEGIREWISSPESKPILCLYGQAGAGKSTISRTVARLYQNQGASFFFNRDEADRSNIKKFFTTIAWSLGQCIPELQAFMSKAIEDEPSIPTMSPSEQFEKLIHEPLSKMRVATPQTFVIVIDALDECEVEAALSHSLIKCLSRLTETNGLTFRVFITSRPEIPVQMGFQKLPASTYQSIQLDEIETPIIEHDIHTLFKSTFEKILDNDRRQQPEDCRLPEGWPGDEIIDILVQMTAPLFISASALCRYITSGGLDPQRSLEAVLNFKSGTTSDVYQIYRQVLDALVAGRGAAEKKEIVEEVKNIAGTIVLLEDPLSTRSISTLLSLDHRNVVTRLRSLQSVLVVPDSPEMPVRTFHRSFRDFLLSSKEFNKFWVDEKEGHGVIAELCINLLSRCLKENVCGLSSPGTPREQLSEAVRNEHLPAEVRYACEYWIHHLVKSGHRIRDGDIFHGFLKEHLLHWLEATGLIGVAAKLIDLVSKLRKSRPCGRQVSRLLGDMERLVQRYQHVIDEAPLQVYSSALVFAPEKSVIRSLFLERHPRWAELVSKTDQFWGPIMQVFQGHENGVEYLKFSPDGTQIASSGLDYTTKIWGRFSGKPLETYNTYLTKPAFSRDGKIAIYTDKQNFEIRQVGSKELLQTLEISCACWVPEMCFLDDKLVVTVDFEQIQIWEISPPKLLSAFNPSPTESNEFNAADVITAFSLDGKLFSFSVGNHIHVWSVESGTLVNQLTAAETVVALAFSKEAKGHDRDRLASASTDNTITIWSPTSGKPLRAFNHRSQPVEALEYFSSNVLASISSSGGIHLSGELQETPLNHPQSATSLASPPDRSALAVGLCCWTVARNLKIQSKSWLKNPLRNSF
ncbi:hypothetical protein ABW19_dt0200538 [Dactylella cylindrospora]|nr:hypothetical protein ABW19_dt0200538 [Dactylella cylindrospora]